MKNKKNLTIAITSIVLVMLILLGLTYAYYRTRVIGNDKKSVGVMTKNLELVYADGSPNITVTNFEPSDNVYEKVFTVKNEGDDTVSYRVFLIDVVNTFERKDDIKYTLECTTNGTLPCGEVNDETTFPSKRTEISSASIEPNKTHTYTFRFTYKDTGTDQSVDMGKTLSAKLQIYGDEITFEEGTLAAAILQNAKENTNGTVYLETPRTKVAEEISAVYLGAGEISDTAKKMYVTRPLEETTIYDGDIDDWVTPTSCNDVIGTFFDGFGFNPYKDTIANRYIEGCENSVPYYYVDGDSTLSIAADDYGTSYYFRGSIEDNYVTFADMCWRIVRVAGDGSIKLILEDANQTCSSNMDGVWALPTEPNGTEYIGVYGYEKKNVDSNSYEEMIMNYLEPKEDKEYSMVKVFYDFQTTLKTKISDLYSGKTIEDMLKSGDWCLGDKAYSSLTATNPLEEYNYENNMFYDAYLRLTGNPNGYQPTFKCNGTILNEFLDVEEVSSKTPMYVSAITADEVVYAGGIVYNENNANIYNQDYYLISDAFKSPLSWGTYQIVEAFWTLTPSIFYDNDEAYSVNYEGTIVSNWIYTGHDSDDWNVAIRPVISLKEGITITSGDGTIDDPYVVG